jgi:hypothetical protein
MPVRAKCDCRRNRLLPEQTNARGRLQPMFGYGHEKSQRVRWLFWLETVEM